MLEGESFDRINMIYRIGEMGQKKQRNRSRRKTIEAHVEARRRGGGKAKIEG